jgi:hypothetical protein
LYSYTLRLIIQTGAVVVDDVSGGRVKIAAEERW